MTIPTMLRYARARAFERDIINYCFFFFFFFFYAVSLFCVGARVVHFVFARATVDAMLMRACRAICARA